MPTKVRLVKAMVFPVVMYGCETWTVKKAECWRIDAFELLEKSLESPLDCKEIQPVHRKGNQSWIFIGRTDAEAETPIIWQPHVKSWLIGKDPDAGKDWGQQEKGMTEDEMVGLHHQLNAHGFEWTPGVGDGQGGLACCSSWSCGESDTTERLNWTELIGSYLGDPGLIPRFWRSPGEGNGYPLQYSCLENSMNRGAWWATIHGVAKSWSQLMN